MTESRSGALLSFRPEEMIDVTRSLGYDDLAWPGAKRYSGREHDIEGYVITSMRLTAHAGTHMDAPRHRFPEGMSIDGIPPSTLVCPALVLDCGKAAVITPGVVGNADISGKALLLRTAASDYGRDMFREDYPALTGKAAEHILDRGALLVGIDYLSVDLFEKDDAHDVLLGAGIPQIEDLKLDHVRPGEYILFCFPLRIHNGEASPIRAFLAPAIALSG